VILQFSHVLLIHPPSIMIGPGWSRWKFDEHSTHFTTCRSAWYGSVWIAYTFKISIKLSVQARA
jgi:hypothetical protein